MRITAQDIIKLLALKHAGDVFVPECKNGPSQQSSHVRLDAWAMPRSWTSASIRGYEVKVSKADFTRDQKWHHYLPLCNQLYFVCPTNLILPSEMPEAVGLMWVSKTGTKLYEKKKAAFRDIAISENVFRYILMCRALIVSDTHFGTTSQDKATFWREWLEKKEADRWLGHAVGSAYSKQLLHNVATMEHELRMANAKMQLYDKIRDAIIKLGLNPDRTNEWEVDRRIRELREAVPPSLMSAVIGTRKALSGLESRLVKLNTANEPNQHASGIESE